MTAAPPSVAITSCAARRPVVAGAASLSSSMDGGRRRALCRERLEAATRWLQRGGALGSRSARRQPAKTLGVERYGEGMSNDDTVRRGDRAPPASERIAHVRGARVHLSIRLGGATRRWKSERVGSPDMVPSTLAKPSAGLAHGPRRTRERAVRGNDPCFAFGSPDRQWY
jgi:hypothetical protein